MHTLLGIIIQQEGKYKDALDQYTMAFKIQSKDDQEFSTYKITNRHTENCN